MAYKILFLCSKNSARSQMAEAIVNYIGNADFSAYSAGAQPAEQIHPMAAQVMKHSGIDMAGRRPKSMSEYAGSDFDFVITLCDSMKENCPVFPGHPIYAHWGMPDPAEYSGSDEEKLRFFRKTMIEITFRVNLFMSLPFEKLDRLALEQKVKEIGSAEI